MRMTSVAHSATLLSTMLIGALMILAPVNSTQAGTPKEDLANSYVAQGNLLKQIMDDFGTLCYKPDKTVDMGKVIQVEKGLTISCSDEVVRIQGLIDNYQKTKVALIQCLSDDGYDHTAGGLARDIDKILAEAPTCKDGVDTKILSLKCVSEVTCNMENAFGIPNFRNLSSRRTCSRLPADFDCLENLVAGLFKDVAQNGKFIWDSLKWAGKKIGTWTGLRKVEEKSSNQALLASQAQPSIVKTLIDNPGLFLEHFIESLYESTAEGIKTSFGCEQWEGKPYASACKIPMQGWDCATCTQRLNSVCGVVGYLGGEIVSSYLTAGALGLTKTVAVGIAKGIGFTAVKTAKLATVVAPSATRAIARMAQAFPKEAVAARMSQAMAATSKVADGMNRSLNRSIREFKKGYVEAKAAQKAEREEELSRQAAEEAKLSPEERAALKLKRQDIQKITIAIKAPIIVPVKLVLEYFYLMNRAWDIGLGHGEAPLRYFRKAPPPPLVSP